MTAQTFDAVQYKGSQRRGFDDAANGWRKWWKIFEQGGQPVSDRLVEVGKVQPGHRVLDVATGIGEPAVTAARKVGANGRVVATDLSPQMLVLAQERAAALEMSNLYFQEMDAEALDLPENSFNAVLCRWGLMLLPDLASALKGIHRLLAPEGRFATAVWGAPPEVPMIMAPLGVVQKVLQLPPPSPGTPGPFSLAAPGLLEQAFIAVGFGDVRTESMTVTFEWPSAEAFTSFMRDVTPPINALLANQPEEQKEKVWQAITKVARQHDGGNGRIRMANETIIVVGQRQAEVTVHMDSRRLLTSGF